jgi:hypothetical protein
MIIVSWGCQLIDIILKNKDSIGLESHNHYASITYEKC